MDTLLTSDTLVQVVGGVALLLLAVVVVFGVLLIAVRLVRRR